MKLLIWAVCLTVGAALRVFVLGAVNASLLTYLILGICLVLGLFLTQRYDARHQAETKQPATGLRDRAPSEQWQPKRKPSPTSDQGGREDT